MNKFWRIYAHEYTRHVLRRRFLIALLSVPAWIVFALGLGLISVLMMANRTPVGYVDPAGIIVSNNPGELTISIYQVSFLPFPTEEEAHAALQAKQIQAYFILPDNYQKAPGARLVYIEEPNAVITTQFRNLLRYNLLSGQPGAVTQRVIGGHELVIHATSEKKQVANRDWFKIIAPIAASIFLTMSVVSSSGYLMQAVVEEKENRTMEILVTSVSPETIMSGKTLALISVGLTQVFIWSIFPLAAILLVGPYLPFLQAITIDWKLVGLIFATVLPTFIFIAAVMATIGATVTNEREGQQISGLVTLPVMIPFMLSSLIMMHPNGLFALVLSFIPITAAMTLLLRMGFATVPTWQIILSSALLITTAAGTLRLSGRVFRMGMLRYGKRLSWKEIFRAAVSRRSIPALANGKKGG